MELEMENSMLRVPRASPPSLLSLTNAWDCVIYEQTVAITNPMTHRPASFTNMTTSVLQQLQAEFELTDEQLTALPSARTNFSWHIYLYRTAGHKRQYQLEITSVNREKKIHYELYKSAYCGTVKTLITHLIRSWARHA